MIMNIVLHEPEIPANTGNIGRTCVATGTSLHLIKPLGFDISDKAVRRAGMDYWKDLDLYVYEDFSEFIVRNPNARIYMATTKAKKAYTEGSSTVIFFTVLPSSSETAKSLPSYNNI